jgi:hypothetical protein
LKNPTYWIPDKSLPDYVVQAGTPACRQAGGDDDTVFEMAFK